MEQTADELKFAENVKQLQPILKDLDYLLSDGRVTLTGMKYRMQNQNLTIQENERKIVQAKALLDDLENQLKEKFSTKETELAQREKTLQVRAVELNHKERELDRKEETLNKQAWELNNKKEKVKA